MDAAGRFAVFAAACAAIYFVGAAAFHASGYDVGDLNADWFFGYFVGASWLFIANVAQS